MNIPLDYLLWMNADGILVFPNPQNRVQKLCRCGIVEQVIHSESAQGSTFPYYVALKIMDRHQLVIQNDDVGNEVDIMEQLQPAGFSTPPVNAHFLRWGCCSDLYNMYIGTEFAHGGSLCLYVRQRISHIMVSFVIL